MGPHYMWRVSGTRFDAAVYYSTMGLDVDTTLGKPLGIAYLTGQSDVQQLWLIGGKTQHWKNLTRLVIIHMHHRRKIDVGTPATGVQCIVNS